MCHRQGGNDKNSPLSTLHDWIGLGGVLFEELLSVDQFDIIGWIIIQLRIQTSPSLPHDPRVKEFAPCFEWASVHSVALPSFTNNQIR